MFCGCGLQTPGLQTHFLTTYEVCINSAGLIRCALIKFLRSNQACLAFSKPNLLGELLVSILASGVLAFLPIWASNGVIFVIPCGVMRSFLIISATSEVNLNGKLFSSILITPRRR